MFNFNISWSRYDGKVSCLVAHLIYDEEKTKNWEFFYDQEGFAIAYNLGFRGFAEFPDIEKKYSSPSLFDVFSDRIQRLDNNKVVNEISESEKAKFLEISKAHLNTDKISIEYQGRQKTYGESRR